MNSLIQPSLLRRLLMPLLFLICGFVFYNPAQGQQLPPKPISVRVYINESLNFGTFCIPGSGIQTITVDTYGARTSSTGILKLGALSSAARFVITAIPGTIIHVQNFPGAQLTDGHGNIIFLEIGESYPLSPLIATGEYTEVNIGGTLTVNSGGPTPAGNYNGTYSINFIQE